MLLAEALSQRADITTRLAELKQHGDRAPRTAQHRVLTHRTDEGGNGELLKIGNPVT